jgi:CheY-like chemotaxis protein
MTGEAPTTVVPQTSRPLFMVGVGASASRVRDVTAGLVRLVALTGYGLPHDRARATESGFDRHILKPVEPSVLFRVLREMSA